MGTDFAGVQIGDNTVFAVEGDIAVNTMSGAFEEDLARVEWRGVAMKREHWLFASGIGNAVEADAIWKSKNSTSSAMNE